MKNAMKNAMKRLITIALASLFAFGLAGCNTIEGVGKDVKKTGETIEKAAKK
jgi:predicted small secreted protein